MYHTHRTAIRRALAALLCAAMLLAPLSAAGAEPGVYDPDAALAYAAGHWNDGVGQCATFVSACVTAGGIPVREPAPYNLYRKLLPYGTPYLLSPTNGRYYILGTTNEGKVVPGDPLFFVCETCGNAYLHAALCSSIDREGLHDYAHNNAHNNKIVYEDLKRSDHPQPTHKIVLYSLHMSSEAPVVDPTTDNGTVTLTWDAVPGAESYRVQIFPFGGTEPVFTEDNIAVPTCALTLPAGDYSAEITANGVEGDAATLPAKLFSVSAAPLTEEPAIPEEPAPEESAGVMLVRLFVQMVSALLNFILRMVQSR